MGSDDISRTGAGDLAPWQAEVDQLISAFADESEQEKRDAIAWAKARHGDKAEAYVAKALFPAPVPAKQRLAEAVARLDCFEDWQEWLAGAVGEAVADPGLREGLRQQADRWGLGAGDDFIVALEQTGIKAADGALTGLEADEGVSPFPNSQPPELAPPEPGRELAVLASPSLPMASPISPMGLIVFQPDADDQAGPKDASGRARAVLNPRNPLEMTKEFIRRHCINPVDSCAIVRHWQGQYYFWNGTFFETLEEEILRQQVLTFLASSVQRISASIQPIPFVPTKALVNEVMFHLGLCLALAQQHVPPMWLDTSKPAKEMVAFRNGIVNVFTGEMLPLTHHFWAHSALKFDWDPSQPCPVWEKFLAEVFPNDPEAWAFLEEMMGYCMTEETKLGKGAMLIGKSRSGKGTIARLILQLVGPEASVSLSIHNWLKGEHSAQPLIGKRVGVFPDWRGKPGKQFGANYDPGGLDPASQELLLKITGDDDVTIPRKYIDAWHGKLPMKIVIASNKVPNLNDPTLNTRFIKLRFNVSFADNPDIELLGKLSAELSGIAGRCVAAYQRAYRRGRFIQPASGLALDREILAASDAVAAMAMDCFVLDPDGTAIRTFAYCRFISWCDENRRGEIKVADNQLGKLLRTVAGFENIRSSRPNDPITGKQGPRVWHGFRLRDRIGEEE